LDVISQKEEIMTGESRTLNSTQEELGHLRALWDMAAVVMREFEGWNATAWDRIDTDSLIEEAKKLAKQVKTLNKAIHSYDAYRCAIPNPGCSVFWAQGSGCRGVESRARGF
jgi:hypothetical protein